MADATVQAVPEAGGELPRQARGWGIPVLLAVVAVIGAVALGLGVASVTDRHHAQTVSFVVPEGTAEKVVLGQPVEIMPTEVDLKIGDTLVIRNEDTQTITVGPFTVRAGETLRQTFQTPQTLTGECSLSGTGQIQLIVT